MPSYNPRRAVCTITIAACFLGIYPAGAKEASGSGEGNALYRRALELLDAGKEREAAAEMARAIRTLPNPPATRSKLSPTAESHYSRGIRHMRARRDSLAEKEYRKAIEADPGNAFLRYQLAFLLGNKSDYGGMFKELWKAARAQSLPSERLRALAGLSLLAGKSRDAIAYYREEIKGSTPSPEAMRMLGLVLVESGSPREGFELLQKALKKQPDDYSTLSAAGLAYALSGDYKRAEKFLNSAIKLNRDHPEAQGRLGLVLLLEGHTDESIKRLNEAVKLNPGVAELHVNLAKAYAVAGRLDDVDKHYTLALKADPNNYDGWYEKGNILGIQGKLDKAIEAYKRAVSIEPTLAKAHYKMGLVYARKKMYDEAEAQFKKTIRANCDYADAYYAIALLNREHKKDHKTAAHYYTMYLLYDNASTRAMEAKRWLEQLGKHQAPNSK
ncbi:MAG: tetratricopeptide repeat protein [bacterium]